MNPSVRIPQSDRRAVIVLALSALVLAFLWWWNATLVYDDVILTTLGSKPFGFDYLVGRDGWFRTLLHFFVLDLPDQYRTFGIIRSFQFLLWTVGISSAKAYALFLAASHIVASFVIYMILRRRQAVTSALTASLLWMLSPYLWTSCFHHYSYLAFPTEALLVGVFLMAKAPGHRLITGLSLGLGVLLGLSGELHLAAVPLLLVAFAWLFRDPKITRAYIFVFIGMVLAIISHYTIWKIFEANAALRPRFAVTIGKGFDYWELRLRVGLNSIKSAFEVPWQELVGAGNIPFLVVAFFTAAATFFVLRWAEKKETSDSRPKQQGLLLLSVFLVVVAFSYLTIFLAVVILSDSVPQIMPRRYGYVPLTILLISGYFALFSVVKTRGLQKTVSAVFVALVLGLFFKHQVVVLLQVRKADRDISSQISKALTMAPESGILFFNSANTEFPRSVMYPDSMGPTMQSGAATELNQSVYGSYWGAEMMALSTLKAKYACDIGGIGRGVVKAFCPYGSIPREYDSESAIILANLGFVKGDLFGRHVRIFQNLKEFNPYFFSREFLREVDTAGANQFQKIGQRVYIQKDILKVPTPSKEFLGLPSEEFKIDLDGSDIVVDIEFLKISPDIDTKLPILSVAWDGLPWVELTELQDIDVANSDSTLRLQRLGAAKLALRLPGDQKIKKTIHTIKIYKRPVKL